MKLYELCCSDERLFFSPFAWRIHMALAHKGLSFETVPVKFTDKEKIAFSGQKLVPILVDGDETVCDSWAIMNYLDGTYPDQPLFDCEQSRNYAHMIKFWVEATLGPAVVKTVLMDIVGKLHGDDRKYFVESRTQRFGKPLEDIVLQPEEGVAALGAALGPARKALEDRNFLSGDAPAGADYLLFGPLMWGRNSSSIELLAEGDTVMRAWRERMLDAHDGAARKSQSAH